MEVLFKLLRLIQRRDLLIGQLKLSSVPDKTQIEQHLHWHYVLVPALDHISRVKLFKSDNDTHFIIGMAHALTGLDTDCIKQFLTDGTLKTDGQSLICVVSLLLLILAENFPQHVFECAFPWFRVAYDTMKSHKFYQYAHDRDVTLAAIFQTSVQEAQWDVVGLARDIIRKSFCS